MSTILKIRSAINAVLKTVHPNVIVDGESKSRVHYERAPDKAPFPYLVFLLQNAVDQPGLEQFFLDVDGWDAPVNGSTVALETLMGNVDAALHKRVVNIRPNGAFLSPFQYVEPDPKDSWSFVIYRDRRFLLEDDDPRIRRRKYIYEVRTFEKRRDYHYGQ